MTAQLSRERLEEKLLEHIKHGGDSEEETMIRMLLAGMDSKPVYQLWDMNWYDTDREQYEYLTANGSTGRILYDAPPAPVAVPDKKESISGSVFGEYYCDGWNDCREAMLKAGTVTGWIKCSEQMPEQKQSNHYIGLNLLLNERTVVQGGFDDGSFWLDGVRIDNVTRWMPLPAAPEQDV